MRPGSSRASFALGSRIGTSPTAPRRCCTPRSGSPPNGSPTGCRRPCPTAPTSSDPGGAVKRIRLDSLLAERGVYESRSRAAASVIAGEVMLLPSRSRALKPGQLVAPDVELEVAAGLPYVSRGGVKLANALDAL